MSEHIVSTTIWQLTQSTVSFHPCHPPWIYGNQIMAPNQTWRSSSKGSEYTHSGMKWKVHDLHPLWMTNIKQGVINSPASLLGNSKKEASLDCLVLIQSHMKKLIKSPHDTLQMRMMSYLRGQVIKVGNTSWNSLWAWKTLKNWRNILCPCEICN